MPVDNKMKKKPLIITILILAALTITVISAYLYLSPLFKLKSVATELKSDTYKYNLELTIEGTGSFADGMEFELSGKKGENVLSSELLVDGKKYLDIYADYDFNMVFGCRPLIESVIDSMGNKSGLTALLLNSLMGEVNVSLDQLENIIGKDIITVTDEYISSDFFDTIERGKLPVKPSDIKRIRKVEGSDSLLGDDAYYFRYSDREKGIDCIIAIPKSDAKRMAVKVSYEDMTLTLEGEYSLGAVRDESMPDKLISDTFVDVLKAIYQEYNKLK